ncbi:MAG TPA: hypothetical protein VMT77_00805 [Gemmatimonadales bacterium]|nr:hypothetical protein [Gemmatimonadales bacterium]
MITDECMREMRTRPRTATAVLLEPTAKRAEPGGRSRIFNLGSRACRAGCVALAALAACHRASPPAASETTAATTTSAGRDTTLGVPAPDSAAQAAAAFVQSFYGWYKQVGERYEDAVADSPGWFAPALVAAMRLDNAASRANPSEVVGLDWDPFLDTQDPCDPYQVTGTSRRGDTVLAAVNGMCNDRPPQVEPDVIAEVRFVGRRWVFVDFRHVGNPGSLVQDLRILAASRDSDTTRAGSRRR